MDVCSALVVVCNLHNIQVAPLVPILTILMTMLVIIILAVSAAVLTCKILQGKTKRNSSYPLQNPVPEQSRDKGSLVIAVTTNCYNGGSQRVSRESTCNGTVQPVEQQSTDVGELILFS